MLTKIWLDDIKSKRQKELTNFGISAKKKEKKNII